MAILGIPSATCCVLFFACHVTLSTATCQCQSRDDEYKYCKADFVMDAVVRGTKTSDDPNVSLYRISIRKVLKDGREFSKYKASSVLVVSKDCDVALRRGQTYFITGEYSHYSVGGKLNPALETSACELVASYQSGKYKSDASFRNKLNAWHKTGPNCRDVKLKGHFLKD